MKIPHEENALNEVNVLCREAADHFELAATLCHDEPLANTFHSFARERRNMSDALIEHIRTLGLPKFPDPEKEGLEHLRARLKVAVSLDERRTLIKDMQQSEQKLGATILSALQENIPEDTRVFLETALAQIAKAQRLLTIPESAERQS